VLAARLLIEGLTSHDHERLYTLGANVDERKKENG